MKRFMGIALSFWLIAIVVSGAEETESEDNTTCGSFSASSPMPEVRSGGFSTTRQERLRQARLQRIKDRQVEEPGTLHKWMRPVERKFAGFIRRGSATEDEDSYGFFPQFGMITTGSGISGGVRYSQKYLETSATISVRAYQQYEVLAGLNPPRGSYLIRTYRPADIFQFSGIETDKPGVFVYGHLRYRDFPREDFYGLGPSSSLNDRTDYRFTEARYYAVAGYQFNNHIRIDVRGGLFQPDVSGGSDDEFPDTQEVFTEASAPGLLTQPDFFHLKASLLFDYTDDADDPHRGLAVGVMLNRYYDTDNRGFDFARYAIDARYYRPLWADNRVFAFRFLTSMDEDVGDSRVPFYLQETLGGSNTLRGFPHFRFRDEKQLHFSFEYRWEAISFIELAAFYDVGKVFGDFAEWDLRDLSDSYGAGVRFRTDGGVFLRFDVARSSEDTRFIFKFGPSF